MTLKKPTKLDFSAERLLIGDRTAAVVKMNQMMIELQTFAAEMNDVIDGINALSAAWNMPLINNGDGGKTLQVKRDMSGYEIIQRYFPAGSSLPAEDLGPIWHADYAGWMTWQTFSANGASYSGYASVDIGTPRMDGQPTQRAGYIKAAGETSALTKNNALYTPLYHWARHHGLLSVDYTDYKNNLGQFRFFDTGTGSILPPDLRGVFFRGWDQVRQFGSKQQPTTVSPEIYRMMSGNDGLWVGMQNTEESSLVRYSDDSRGHALTVTVNNDNLKWNNYPSYDDGWRKTYAVRPLNVALNAVIKF